jgi:hypothetical protein
MNLVDSHNASLHVEIHSFMSVFLWTKPSSSQWFTPEKFALITKEQPWTTAIGKLLPAWR